MPTTLTQVAPTAARLPQQTGRAAFAGALRSEFTKIRSVRSTYWSLIALVVVMVGIGALAGGSAASNPVSWDPASTRPA